MAHRLNTRNLREAAASLGDDTNSAIAKRAGLGEATISRLMKGTHQPRMTSLYRLRMAYRMSIDDLMTDDEGEMDEQAAA